MTNVEDSAKGSPSSPAVPSDEDDWTMCALVKVEAEGWAGCNRFLRKLQGSCSAKSCKLKESVSTAAGIAVEMVDDAVMAA